MYTRVVQNFKSYFVLIINHDIYKYIWESLKTSILQGMKLKFPLLFGLRGTVCFVQPTIGLISKWLSLVSQNFYQPQRQAEITLSADSKG